MQSGETAQVTLAPDEGYAVFELTVEDSNGDFLDYECENEDPDVYTFGMPEASLLPVTVKADFRKKGTVHVCPMDAYMDVEPQSWYHVAVDFALDEGLMQGISDTLFASEETTTRAQEAQILYNLEGAPAADAAPTFADLDSNAWYVDAISWVCQEGLMQGNGDGTFAPDSPITREQLAMLLYRYAQYRGCTTEKRDYLVPYADCGDISSWAVEAMSWASAEELIYGMDASHLAPQEQATRAQVATLLYRGCMRIGEKKL